MPAPFDNIVQHLFHQPSLLSVTVDELERMAGEHPYFAAAHFLLLKKMQDIAHPQFKTQLQKTALYFNNPMWLQFLLQPQNVTGFKVAEESPFISNESTTGMPAAVVEPKEENMYADAPAEQQHESDEPAELNAVTEKANIELPEYQSNEPVTTPPDGEYNMVSIAEHFEQGLPETTPADNNTTLYHSFYQRTDMEAAPQQALQERTAEPVITEPANEAPAETDVEPSAEESSLPELQQEHHNLSDETTVEGQPGLTVEEQPVGTIEAAAGPEETASFSASSNEPAEISAHEIEAAAEKTEEASHSPAEAGIAEETPAPLTGGQATAENKETGDEEVPEQEEKTPDETMAEHAIKASIARTIIEMPEAKNDVLFEPYHTIDYFASQGIKLSKMEADSKDKLGMQLKSFTAWLKTLKKLPKASVDHMLAENDESRVVEDAIHSIETKEVITEAMAEVFEKQGLYEKATEVYRKLSLLNPGKSVYFAARIEALKIK